MRKLKNTIFTLLIAVSMTVATIPTMVFAEGEDGDIYYKNSEESNINEEQDQNQQLPTDNDLEESNPEDQVENTQDQLENTQDQVENTQDQLENTQDTQKLQNEEEYTVTIYFRDNSGQGEGIDKDDAQNAIQKQGELEEPLVLEGFKLGEQFDIGKDPKKYEQIQNVEAKLAAQNYYPNRSDYPLAGEFQPDPKGGNTMDIILYYQYEPYTYTFNYLEKGNPNKQIQKSKVMHVPSGKYDFSQYKSEIKGYVYDSADPADKLVGSIGGRIGEVVTPDVAKERSIEVNLYYKSKDDQINKPDVDNKEYKVTYNYLDINSKKQIANSIDYKFKNGESYDFSQSDLQKILGYKFVKIEGETKGVIKGQDVVINVYYEETGELVAKTGDYNNLLGWGAVVIVAVGGLIFFRKKLNK